MPSTILGLYFYLWVWDFHIFPDKTAKDIRKLAKLVFLRGKIKEGNGPVQSQNWLLQEEGSERVRAILAFIVLRQSTG
jgi:hypothetical protein